MGRRGLLCIVLLLLGACAQVREITGGEKDSVPPVLLSAKPENGSVHFNSKVILLEFDERIQLDKVRDRLLISPPLEEQPTVKIVGSRGVEITLNGALQPNTTYTFNLGECVKDLAEGNAAPGLSYVLSTGDQLDALRVSGAVVNAFTGQPEKDMLVMLHAEGDTTSFRSGRPAYMTRCDALGIFSIPNLPEGRFDVYALHDKNANYRYDLPNEEIAFLDSACVLSGMDSVAPILLLNSFLPTSPSQQVRSSKVVPDGALQLVLARSADTLTIRDVARSGGALVWDPEWNRTRDTVLLWPSDTTLLVEGSYAVSDGGLALDTIRYRPVQRMPFNTGLSAVLKEDGTGASIRLRAARPIREVDTARFELVRDSIPLSFRVERNSEDTRTILLNADLPPGSSAWLTVLPKAVRDIYDGVNDTLRVALGRAAEQATGTLRVNVSGLDSNEHYLLQLLDGQQRTTQSALIDVGAPTVHWQRLLPGRSTLRLVADHNRNGHWDTGEWASRRQPERTWYHPEAVNVRAAWDVVVDWKLD
ncbi:MAG TPA: Ig-like domain-containing protein [Flavobacteriales bacterium]|nr:Ig-like domain-containing protein [Flavobacteriales bacterium]